ncbi:DUF5986 family protein [Clostridium perfringens]|uniref:DUF5986 family protein n=1 Tax=Clostridium perfringens TaxID=1502 RepID=UPI002443B185|nr:DUF5986 family protein [Clostridium perfringens]MDG6893032.1 hypothetical protein [Clostridium perfringens]
MGNNIIKLNKEYKNFFVQILQNGLDRFKEHELINKTVTNIGSMGTKWDMINSEFKEALDKSIFDTVICKRGIWEFLLIYDKLNNTLYTLMKDKRFEDLVKTVKSDKVHYLEALTTVNISLCNEEREQMTFLENLTKEKEEKIEKTVEELFKDIDGNIDRHILIRFTDKDFELYSISASIVTPALDVLMKEDWAEYIQPKYTLEINDNDLLCDEEDIDLSLKEISNDIIINEIKIKKISKERNNIR